VLLVSSAFKRHTGSKAYDTVYAKKRAKPVLTHARIKIAKLRRKECMDIDTVDSEDSLRAWLRIAYSLHVETCDLARGSQQCALESMESSAPACLQVGEQQLQVEYIPEWTRRLRCSYTTRRTEQVSKESYKNQAWEEYCPG